MSDKLFPPLSFRLPCHLNGRGADSMNSRLVEAANRMAAATAFIFGFQFSYGPSPSRYPPRKNERSQRLAAIPRPRRHGMVWSLKESIFSQISSFKIMSIIILKAVIRRYRSLLLVKASPDTCTDCSGLCFSYTSIGFNVAQWLPIHPTDYVMNDLFNSHVSTNSSHSFFEEKSCRLVGHLKCLPEKVPSSCLVLYLEIVI